MTITDNGSLSFGNGDALSMYGAYGATQQIVVGNGGLLTITGTTITTSNMNGATHLITVNAGGHMQASNSSFPSSLNQVALNSGCIFNAGDLTGNSFNCPLYLPLNDVPYLSGTGNNNAQFQNIYMLAGSVASGQTLALAPSARSPT